MDLKLDDYRVNLLKMMKKFGPAVSSVAVEKRESALQELVKDSFATMMRTDDGQIRYAITNEGRLYLEGHAK